eukprot:c18458_g1_i1 orf=1-1452(-)
MEAKERSKGYWQWRGNLRAMQLRVKERLRVASSPRAFLPRLHNRKSLLVAGAPKPFSALLSTFLSKHLNFAAAVAIASSSSDVQPTSSNGHYQHQHADSNYTAVFSENSYAVRLLQAVALPLIGNVCHAFMHGFNQTEVYCAEKLLNVVSHRPQGQPLITVSNHVASMDDPLVLAAILPPHVLFQAQCLRWTLCATDRCFTNLATSAFFQCVKVLPLARGAGVYQKGIDMAVEKLKRGDWIHIFPEGSRSRDGGKTVQAAKRGIGRLVLDAGKVPLVIPFVHSGMQEVMPIGSKFPSIRKRVVVLVGDPIEMDDLFAKFQAGETPKAVIHEAIAFRVGQSLKKLKEELDHLVLSSTDEDFKQRHLTLESDSSDQTDGFLEVFNFKRNRKHKLELDDNQGNHHLDVIDLSEPQNLRASVAFSDEALHLASTSLARMNSDIFQEGIVTRLKRLRDPAALVGFAAQGLLRYDYTGLGKVHLKVDSFA